MKKVLVITRLSPPSQLDKLEFGTLCIIQGGSDKPFFYGQLSKNSEEPNWQQLELPSEEACLRFLQETV